MVTDHPKILHLLRSDLKLALHVYNMQLSRIKPIKQQHNKILNKYVIHMCIPAKFFLTQDYKI